MYTYYLHHGMLYRVATVSTEALIEGKGWMDWRTPEAGLSVSEIIPEEKARLIVQETGEIF